MAEARETKSTELNVRCTQAPTDILLTPTEVRCHGLQTTYEAYVISSLRIESLLRDDVQKRIFEAVACTVYVIPEKLY